MDDDMKKQLDKLKPSKKKLTIPTDLLQSNSYEDKLLAIKMMADSQQPKIVQLIKNMLKK
jgi:hypothetical protein